jgi:hypothetical protein
MRLTPTADPVKLFGVNLLSFCKPDCGVIAATALKQSSFHKQLVYLLRKWPNPIKLFSV